MKICLLNPPSEKGYIRSGRWTRKTRGTQSWYPIWLGYCTALLEREGHECVLLDASVENLNEPETTKLIKKFYPELIVYYWGYSTHKKDLTYADYLEKEICKVILVGPWWYCLPDALKLTKHVHLMTYGEFEHTVLEVTKNINISDIKGLFWKNHLNGEIIKNPPRPLCSKEELDKFPFVTEVYKRHLNIKNYRQTSFRYPFVDLLGARGCPYHCTYCLWIRAFQGGPSYRPRSVKNIIKELWYIKNELPEVKQIFFQDDTLPAKRMKTLSQTILDENLKITWGGYSRAEIPFGILKLAKESGLRTLHVGYENCHQKTLDLIQKGLKKERMEQFAKDIQKLDLWTCAGFMIFPWETQKEVRETIQWAKKVIKPRRFSFTQLFAYPNIPVCKIVQKMPKQLTVKEMTQLEKEGFKEFYLKNPNWWWDAIKHPREWKNVLSDAGGLLNFLRE